ncbi:MAG: hypothetical protein IIV90_02875, partial [Oscillospiraceae bacterium]|nr:hypothetical protein [Oscillospiraceae bacterium]
YYLLSNGPERACVSCYDPDLPTGQRVRPLLREGLPLADQQELYTREFHDRLLAALPPEYRQEPEHWLVACSRDLFIGFSQEILTESLMSAGYSRPRPVADTDAVMAFYEDRFCAVSRLPKDAGLLVFTAGEEDFCAEIFVLKDFKENLLPARYGKAGDASAAGRFLKEVLARQDDRPIGAILCSGPACCRDEFLRTLLSIWPDYNTLYVSGSAHAVICGLEVMAERLIKADILERQWLMRVQPGSEFVRSMDAFYQDAMVAPCQDIRPVDQFFRQALEEWASLKYRSGKILDMALQKKRTAGRAMLNKQLRSSQELYARSLFCLREELLALLEKTCPEWKNDPVLQKLFQDTIRNKRHIPAFVFDQQRLSREEPSFEDRLTELLKTYRFFTLALEDKPMPLDSAQARRSQLKEQEQLLWSIEDQLLPLIRRAYKTETQSFLQEAPRMAVLAAALRDIQADICLTIEKLMVIPSLEAYRYAHHLTEEMDADYIRFLLRPCKAESE